MTRSKRYQLSGGAVILRLFIISIIFIVLLALASPVKAMQPILGGDVVIRELGSVIRYTCNPDRQPATGFDIVQSAAPTASRSAPRANGSHRADITSPPNSQTVLKQTAGTLQNSTNSSMADWVLIVVLGSLCVLLVVLIIVLYLGKKKMGQRLKQVAYMDILTGASNLVKFKMDAETLLKTKATTYVMLCFDVDKFKFVNDMYGYDSGNGLLVYLANIFMDDLDQDEAFGRISADNFVCLMKFKDQESMKKRLDYLYHKIQSPSAPLKNFGKVTINCGIYLVESVSDSITSMIDKANMARKMVKKQNGKIMAYYDESMRQQVIKQKEIENTMVAALAHQEFVVFLQPKISLETDKIIGAEALVRWKHPKKGLLPPVDFIGLFERNGFIIPLDYFVFEEVCRHMRIWLNQKLPVYPISINVSRLHLRDDSYVDQYERIAKKYEISPSLIELELTESIIFDNIQELLIQMQRLKEIGFMLSIDDFGAGYSSLNMLKEIPVDTIKLDREFFSNGGVNEREKVVIGNMVNMIQELHMKVLSEGVETVEQAEFLKKIRCDMAQGYLYARPMPIEEYQEALIKQEQG